MCNATATAAQSILNALAARIKNGSVFTAFDVTTDARDGTNERINHVDTREIVHNEFAIGEFPDNYNRQEQIELDNGQIAICYYPDGKSASDHPKAKQITAPQTASQTLVAPSPVPLSPSPPRRKGGNYKDGDSFICDVTAKGVINIPQDIVDKVTISGGTYDIQSDGDIIYKKPDGEGRLRISSSKLGDGKQFRIGVDKTANTITVEQV